MERFLSIALPSWPADRVRRRLARAGAAPAGRFVVLTARPNHTHRATTRAGHHRGSSGQQPSGLAPTVVHTCARARAAGVRPGISLAQARGLLLHRPLHVEGHDAVADAAALQALARAAQRYSPRVAADPPDGLLLEIGGSERLFGGERALVAAALVWLAELGFEARAGVASTIGAAWALARYAASESPAHAARVGRGAERDALAPLPVAALRLDEPLLEALHELGLATVADVLRLPRCEVPARLGTVLLERLDQALGQRAETLTRVHTNEDPSVAREFAGPVESRVLLALVVRELLDELVDQLAEQDLVCAELLVELWPSDAPAGAGPIAIARHTSRAGRDPRLLWALLEPRIEQAPIGFGIERVTLCARGTTRTHTHQGSFTPTLASAPRIDRELGELVDVLRGRLGERAAFALDAREDRRPECTFVPRAPHELPTDAQIERRPRPTRLFDPAPPVEVELLDGLPGTFVRDGQRFRLRRCAGPERLLLPWWPSAAPSLALRVQQAAARHGAASTNDTPASTRPRHTPQATPLVVPRAAPAAPHATSQAGAQQHRPARPPSTQRDYFRAQDQGGRWWWLCRVVQMDADVSDVDRALIELERTGSIRGDGLSVAWFLHGEWA